ncbi:MAG: hypothetical protein ACI9WU_000901 [Myxococcota bacterium]|jgi:hypothetical protein
MKIHDILIRCMVAGSLFAACAETPTTSSAPKPTADPDQATMAGKADGLTDYYTTQMGHLLTNDEIKQDISFPDWFHGWTLDLKKGQVIRIRVQATDDGYVRLYGPAAFEIDGQPWFDRAVASGDTDADGDGWSVTYDHTVDSDGTYMVLYGPKWDWNATYTIETECISGCLPADACETDSQCGVGEVCAHNGVVCITHPCDVSYNVCQADPNAGTDGNNGDKCAEQSDCSAGFCGCMDSSCDDQVCKPWSAEGESCGGFVMPQYFTMCAPTEQCMGPGFIADLPGSCGAQVAVSDLQQNPSKFDGRFVAIQGVVAAGIAMCTKMACSQENPCCNSCGAGQHLYGKDPGSFPNGSDGIEIHQDDQQMGCGGNECTYMDSCTIDNGGWWMAGWWRQAEHGGWYLDVTRKYAAPMIVPVEDAPPG